MGALLVRGRPTVMAANFVNDAIANNKVVIFSKSYCPYCTMAKEVSIRNLQSQKITKKKIVC